MESYRSVRPIDTGAFDFIMIMVLRAATYVGWIVERLGEEGVLARNRRNKENAKTLADAYLTTRCNQQSGQRGSL